MSRIEESGPRAESPAENSRPTATIVITCFNYGNYLAEAIDSALAQSCSPVEVIVVDDGSTDDTRQVALHYRDRITYLYQANSGVSAARNAGIRIARGEFVLTLDADDTLDRDCVAKCVNHLQANPEAGFVYTQARSFGRLQRNTTYPDYDLKRLKKQNFVNHSALVRTSIMRAHMYDESFTGGLEDWNLFLTFAELGIHGVLLDEPLLNYRTHTDRTSRLDSLEYRSRRSRLEVVRAHPDLYTNSERLVANVRAATEPVRIFLGRLKRRLLSRRRAR